MARQKKKKKKKADAIDTGRPLDDAIAQIEKDYGEGAIMRLGDEVSVDVPSISTGAISLDMALGVGGVPRGRVVEIYGPEAAGKTTLALTIVANAQKAGGIAAFIDAEHALDPSYARKIGVDLAELLVSQPDTGEQGLEITERLVRSCAVDVIAIDSIAALVPKAEIEGEMGQVQVGLQARLMSQALRKLAAVIHKSLTCVIFINQIRMKIGVMWGSPETTPGGRALKFYSSVRIDIRRIGSIKDGDDFLGNLTRARVVKNKVAPPFRTAEFDIMFGKGISWEGSLLDVAVEADIVKKAGAWYSYGEMRLGQGREQARDLLIENKELAKEIEDAVRRAHGEDDGEDESKAEAAGTKKDGGDKTNDDSKAKAVDTNKDSQDEGKGDSDDGAQKKKPKKQAGKSLAKGDAGDA